MVGVCLEIGKRATLVALSSGVGADHGLNLVVCCLGDGLSVFFFEARPHPRPFLKTGRGERNEQLRRRDSGRVYLH